MVYPSLTFPILKTRPYFYTNFVSTIDGKIQVTTLQKNEYWPIGSKTDYQTLLGIRAYSDVLIHGYNTALSHKTVDTLARPDFKKLRKKTGKKNDLLYIVLSNHPDEQLRNQLRNTNNIQYEIVKGDVKKLASKLYKEGYTHILVEGGPTLLGSFFKEDLIDEVFLTIAPKIFGNEDQKTLTMVEGHLFLPKEVKNLKLLSVKQIRDELYLRYKVKHTHSR